MARERDALILRLDPKDKEGLRAYAYKEDTTVTAVLRRQIKLLLGNSPEEEHPPRERAI